MRRPLVVLSEDIHPEGRATLEERADVIVASRWDEDTLCVEARNADAIVLRSRGRVSARVMDAAPRLCVIGRHGVGVDNVDVEAATVRGIQVVNVPDANIISVAEHVLATLLALARHIREADRAVRCSDWEQRDRDLGWELCGATVGIVGMGSIGQRVATICQAFEMTIFYTDQIARPEAETRFGARRVELDVLLARSEVVTLHVPLVPSTRHLIGASELNRMQPRAYLVNTSRGGVVDEHALADALRDGRLRGAAIDVFTDEPPAPDNPLLACERVLLTPHSAAMTEQGSRRMARVVDDVLVVLAGARPHHPVNHVPALKARSL